MLNTSLPFLMRTGAPVRSGVFVHWIATSKFFSSHLSNVDRLRLCTNSFHNEAVSAVGQFCSCVRRLISGENSHRRISRVLLKRPFYSTTALIAAALDAKPQWMRSDAE